MLLWLLKHSLGTPSVSKTIRLTVLISLIQPSGIAEETTVSAFIVIGFNCLAFVMRGTSLERVYRTFIKQEVEHSAPIGAVYLPRGPGLGAGGLEGTSRDICGLSRARATVGGSIGVHTPLYGRLLGRNPEFKQEESEGITNLPLGVQGTAF